MCFLYMLRNTARIYELPYDEKNKGSVRSWPSFPKSPSASLTSGPLQPFFAFSGLESLPFHPTKPSFADITRRTPNKQAFPWLRAITGVDQRLTIRL